MTFVHPRSEAQLFHYFFLLLFFFAFFVPAVPFTKGLASELRSPKET